MLIDHLTFFTKIPLHQKGDMDKIAKSQYLFPMVGAITGVILYVVSYLLFIIGIQAVLFSALMLISLYSLTGILHMDGLGDFFDGLAVKGNRKKKIEALKDEKLGTSGTLAIVLFLMLLFSMFFSLHPYGQRKVSFISLSRVVPLPVFFISLVVMEISSKLAMNTLAFFSQPTGEGMGKFFLDRLKLRHYLISLSTAILLVILIYPYLLVILLISQSVPLIINRTAEKNFGGVNGDIIGASNEITRAITLLLLLSYWGWYFG